MASKLCRILEIEGTIDTGYHVGAPYEIPQSSARRLLSHCDQVSEDWNSGYVDGWVVLDREGYLRDSHAVLYRDHDGKHFFVDQ